MPPASEETTAMDVEATTTAVTPEAAADPLREALEAADQVSSGAHHHRPDPMFCSTGPITAPWRLRATRGPVGAQVGAPSVERLFQCTPTTRTPPRRSRP